MTWTNFLVAKIVIYTLYCLKFFKISKLKTFLFYIFCGLSMLSCQTDAVFENKDYLPLENGTEALFEIQETVYSLQEPVQKRTYFLKERVADRQELPNGAFTCNLETYTTDSPTKNWSLRSITPIKKQGTSYIFSVNNIEKVLMVQPLTKGLVWNVNTYNTQKEANVKAVNLGESLTNFNPNWIELAQITFQADSSLLQKNLFVSYYKNKEGMVYSQLQNLEYCQETPDCIGKKQISYGIEVFKKRISKLP